MKKSIFLTCLVFFCVTQKENCSHCCFPYSANEKERVPIEYVWTCHYVVWNRAAVEEYVFFCVPQKKKESRMEFLYSEVDFYIQSPEIGPSLNR